MATLVVNFVLDETGSMGVVKQATISGFNEYLDTLKQRPENIFFSLTKFNSERVVTVHEATLINNVRRLTANNYQPASLTPLYDAIAQAIRRTEEQVAGMVAEELLVLTVVQTDGQENSSREFNQVQIRELINQKKGAGWDFTFIGADMDEWQAQSLGVPAGAFVGYAGTSAGTGAAFKRAARATVAYSASKGATAGDFYNPDTITQTLAAAGLSDTVPADQPDLLWQAGEKKKTDKEKTEEETPA